VKIPGENEQGGYARLQLYRDVIDKCFYSFEKRRQQYETLKSYYLRGSAQGDDPTPYNKVEPVVDTLTAFLYSADSTRFSAHLPPEVPNEEWAKVGPISKAMNSEWMHCGADQLFSQALDWAAVYNSTFVKVLTNDGHIVPYLVDPHCIGVFREDIVGLDRQEAIAHRYYITRSQLESDLKNHPSSASILSNIAAKPVQARDDMPEALRRIIVTNMASAVGPLTPGGTVTGSGSLILPDQMSAEVVEMTELWIRDDDIDGKGRADWRTVTMAEGPVVVYDRPNIFVAGEHPFAQVCPIPMNGYFWGGSFVAKLVGLQAWRNKRVDEIQRLQALEAKPPVALTGFSGLVDETNFALNMPGGVLNNSDPMGKVERFAVKVPDDLFSGLREIDEMFSEAAALPPLLMGRGETGVRSGRQTSELSRLGSSRIKKRALAIEDNLEYLATKMFKALRKYDDTAYLTEPLEPGSKPVKFIFKQAPDDAIIKVDAHSNSPLFIEDQKALALTLIEAHAIDRESFIDMQNPPMKDVLMRRLKTIQHNEAEAAKAKAQHETQVAQVKHSPGPVPGVKG
jgi:hypothetical protein